MGFTVNTRALVGLVGLLDRRAHDVTYAADYLQSQSHLAFGPGLINYWHGTHDRIMKEVDAFLRRASNNYLRQYAAGVDGAITDYNDTDQSANVRFDATLPGVDRVPQPADQSVGPEIFTDPYAFAWKVPLDFEAQYPFKPKFDDVLSASSIPRDVLWELGVLATKLGLLDHPINTDDTLTRPLCGDWAGLARCSFALIQVADALAYTRDRLDAGSTTADRVWSGHAEESYTSSMGRFTTDLQNGEAKIREIARKYREVADSAKLTADLVTPLAHFILDIALSLGLEALVEGPKAISAAVNFADTVKKAEAQIEALHTGIEEASADTDSLADGFSLILGGSVNGNLSASMPVLPTPARHR